MAPKKGRVHGIVISSWDLFHSNSLILHENNTMSAAACDCILFGGLKMFSCLFDFLPKSIHKRPILRLILLAVPSFPRAPVLASCVTIDRQGEPVNGRTLQEGKVLKLRGLVFADHRNRSRQQYCGKQGGSQKSWLAKPKNQDYFCGADNVQRGPALATRPSGYWRRKECSGGNALQDPLIAQTSKAIPILLNHSRVRYKSLNQATICLIGLISILPALRYKMTSP